MLRSAFERISFRFSVPFAYTAAAVFVATAHLLIEPAHAQTASEVTPPTFEPSPQRLTGSVVFSGQPGLDAPDGAELLSVQISGVNIEGELPGMEAEGAAVTERLTGGPVLVSQIFEEATALEAAYVEAGFVLARVVLPAQQLNDGDVLQLLVVDGFVESIDTTAVPEELRGRLQTLTDALVGRRGLQRSELERRILLAGDTYGIALGSALRTGNTPGGTVIILDARYRQITGFVGFDNLQTDALGTYSVNTGLELNGYLGLGETIYFRGSFNPDGVFDNTPRNRTFALGAVFPVGNDGLSLGVEHTNSATTPEDPTAFTTSTFERWSLRAFYPLVRSRDVNVTLRGSLDLQEDKLDIINGAIPVYRDQTSVLRFSSDAAWFLDSGSILNVGGTLSRGLDAFGARTAADAATTTTPLSQQGADAEFTKLEVSAGFRRALGETMAMKLNARGQLSFGDPMLISEQFSIAGFDAVSAFDSGTLSGDKGWMLRGELSHTIGSQIGQIPVEFSPYVFASAGAVHREAPGFGEASNVNATAFGLGMDVFAVRDEAFSNASVRLEVAYGDRDDGGSDGTRISVFGALRF